MRLFSTSNYYIFTCFVCVYTHFSFMTVCCVSCLCVKYRHFFFFQLLCCTFLLLYSFGSFSLVRHSACLSVFRACSLLFLYNLLSRICSRLDFSVYTHTRPWNRFVIVDVAYRVITKTICCFFRFTSLMCECVCRASVCRRVYRSCCSERISGYRRYSFGLDIL